MTRPTRPPTRTPRLAGFRTEAAIHSILDAAHAIDLAEARARRDGGPKLAVHPSNNQNRDATPGQKAMAFAMAWPNSEHGGNRRSSFLKKLDLKCGRGKTSIFGS